MFRVLLPLLALPTPVWAQEAPKQRQLTIDIGTNNSILQVLSNIMVFLATSIVSIALVLFVVGAFMLMIGGVKEDQRQKGKDLMIGSIISLAVVLGAYAMLRTVDWFLAG